MENFCDIVVIGGGHAGAEAAWTAARMGMRTALVTITLDTVAAMSCNPAIGGVGKGQIVREIDAMGAAYGPCCRQRREYSSACSTPRKARLFTARDASPTATPYAKWVQNFLSDAENLDIIEGIATGVETKDGGICGVTFIPRGGDSPVTLGCSAAVVTAGTFLRGVMHRGEDIWPGGRIGEPPADDLSVSLTKAGLELDRLKTGTCPRLAAETIDYSRCTRQDGDATPAPFSFMNDAIKVEQVPCWLTETNEKIHEMIRANFHRAPMYTGQISSTGPRYCPSFETKVERFADKASAPGLHRTRRTRHQLDILQRYNLVHAERRPGFHDSQHSRA